MLKDQEAVSNLISYVIMSGILCIIIFITFLSTNNVFVEIPTRSLTYFQFIDIGNGVSTRMMDIYASAPPEGLLESTFDLPDEILGKDYFVNVTGEDWGQTITLSRDDIIVNISLLGIGGSKNISGSTYGSKVNKMIYNSSQRG